MRFPPAVSYAVGGHPPGPPHSEREGLQHLSALHPRWGFFSSQLHRRCSLPSSYFLLLMGSHLVYSKLIMGFYSFRIFSITIVIRAFLSPILSKLGPGDPFKLLCPLSPWPLSTFSLSSTSCQYNRRTWYFPFFKEL